MTINTSKDDDGNVAPSIGEGVFLDTGAKIIGNKPVENGVSIGANCCVNDMEILDDYVVTNENIMLTIRKRKKKDCLVQQFFDGRI